MVEKSLNILWHSVGPFVYSGYGVVTKNVALRIGQHYPMVISTYYGLHPGASLRIANVRVIPTAEENHGQYSVEHYIKKFKIDLPILASDFWPFAWFANLPNSMFYGPVDSYDYSPDDISVMRNYSRFIACSEFGGKVYRKLAKRQPFAVIPHGVDTKIYKPYPKDECKRIFNIRRDKFIWGIVAANCFDEKTEILTKDGWLKHSDLKMTTQILTLNRRDRIEYQKPTAIIVQNYVGPMYALQTKYLDFLVTPNHKMYVKKRSISKENKRVTGKFAKWLPYERKEVLEIIGKQRWYRKGGVDWVGRNQEEFQVGDSRVPSKPFLKLLGYYLSEGSCNSDSIFIAQKKGPKYDKILKDLKFFNPHAYSDRIAICNRKLTPYFSQFGHAEKKFLPREIKELSKESLEVLWDALVLGDGWLDGPTQYYSSTSKELIDDLQEVLLKLGDSGDVSVQEPRDHFIGKRLIKAENCHPCYSMGRRRYIKEVQNRDSRIKDRKDSLQFYCGKVWSVTVPNHVVYVRRQGKAAFSGQSDPEPRKGWDDMLIAFSLFKEKFPNEAKHWMIFAYTKPSDPRGYNLAEIARKLKLEKHVIFPEHLPQMVGIPDFEMAKLYSYFDVLVNASRREGFCIPVMEAQACGIPVIASDSSALPEIVKDHGWLVKMGDIVFTPKGWKGQRVDREDLGKKIEEAYFNREQHKIYSQESLKFSQQYDWDKIVKEQWLPLLKKLANKDLNKIAVS